MSRESLTETEIAHIESLLKVHTVSRVAFMLNVGTTRLIRKAVSGAVLNGKMARNIRDRLSALPWGDEEG